MYPFLLVPRLDEIGDRLDSRMLADVGLDRFGNPVNPNDARFRICEMHILSLRWVFSIVAKAWQRLGLFSSALPLRHP
jgi:hypothetical protein